MSHYFNSVLVPPTGLAEKIKEFAMLNCAGVADGYCLSNSVFPHVTLCQFMAEKALPIEGASFDVAFKKPNLRDGAGMHDGYTWFEMVVVPSPELIKVQESIANKISVLGGQISTGVGDDYYPHLKFCRIKKDMIHRLENIKVPDEFFVPVKGWRFEVGRSDKNGQYLGI